MFVTVALYTAFRSSFGGMSIIKTFKFLFSIVVKLKTKQKYFYARHYFFYVPIKITLTNIFRESTHTEHRDYISLPFT
jgi:hypothetical protein